MMITNVLSDLFDSFIFILFIIVLSAIFIIILGLPILLALILAYVLGVHFSSSEIIILIIIQVIYLAIIFRGDK